MTDTPENAPIPDNQELLVEFPCYFDRATFTGLTGDMRVIVVVPPENKQDAYVFTDFPGEIVTARIYRTKRKTRAEYIAEMGGDDVGLGVSEYEDLELPPK